jgi:hypothetical protein
MLLSGQKKMALMDNLSCHMLKPVPGEFDLKLVSYPNGNILQE